MTDPCIFCDPAPGAVVFSNADGIVLLDDPIRDGHVLVGVPTHTPNLHDSNPQEVAAMMRLAAACSQVIVERLGAEKTYVVAIGDKDKHFHVHLLPRFSDDPPIGPHIFSGTGWASFLPPSPDAAAVEAVSDALREKLG